MGLQRWIEILANELVASSNKSNAETYSISEINEKNSKKIIKA